MPILDEHTLDFISHSPAQTRRFGARLGALLQAGDVVGLEGELGSGKTCLIQGIGQGLGVAEPITSPTFTLVAEYRPPAPALTLYHIDLYRLDDAVAEAQTFGLDDYLFGDGVCAIEWADRLQNHDLGERLAVHIGITDEDRRQIRLTAYGRSNKNLLKELEKNFREYS